MSDVEKRITEYLSCGGLFNPEHMDPSKVRDLLIACREHIRSLEKVIEPARDALTYMVFDVVACCGLKCREQNCQSCCMEDDAEAFVEKSRQAHSDLNRVLKDLDKETA